MTNKYIIFLTFLVCGMNSNLVSQVNWVNETGLALGTTFTNNDTILNIDGSGLNAVIQVDTTTSSFGFLEPRIGPSDPTIMYIRDADNASFTLKFLNGTADIRLDNKINALNGESITISNVDNENITITQTSASGNGNIFVDGTPIPGALPATVIASSTTNILGSGKNQGDNYYATMNNISEFTWKYNNVAGSSFTEGFSLIIGNTVLPIELISFNLTPIRKNNVQIDWSTATETNNNFFTVEKSLDGEDWEEVSIINGAGNSSIEISYSTIDFTASNGTSYYRLKQTDFDGNYEYSEIKSVNLIGYEDSKLHIYPNPTYQQLTILGHKNDLDEIRIFNILGMEITQLTKDILKSDVKIILDLSLLKPGSYFIKTNSGSQKFFKL